MGERQQAEAEREPPPVEDSELTWLFRWSAADVGFSAVDYRNVRGSVSTSGDARIVGRGMTALPHESMRARGRGRDYEPPITKLRRLEAALEKMRPDQRRVLFAAYTRHEVHLQSRRKFGLWPGVLLLTTRVQSDYQTAIDKIRTKHERIVEIDRADRTEWAGIIREVVGQCRIPRSEQRGMARFATRMAKDLSTTASMGMVVLVPTIVQWLTDAKSADLRCNPKPCSPRCAVHEAEELVADAWDAWVIASNRYRPIRTPQHFVFDRNAPAGRA